MCARALRHDIGHRSKRPATMRNRRSALRRGQPVWCAEHERPDGPHGGIRLCGGTAAATSPSSAAASPVRSSLTRSPRKAFPSQCWKAAAWDVAAPSPAPHCCCRSPTVVSLISLDATAAAPADASGSSVRMPSAISYDGSGSSASPAISSSGTTVVLRDHHGRRSPARAEHQLRLRAGFDG